MKGHPKVTVNNKLLANELHEALRVILKTIQQQVRVI